MPTSQNWVINPCTSFEIADEAGAAGSGTTIDSVEEVRFSLSSSSDYGRSAKHDNARISAFEHSRDASITMVGDEQTLANIAFAFNGTVDGTALDVGSAGGEHVKTLYVNGFGLGGSGKEATVHRAHLEPGTEVTLSRTAQQKYELTFQMLADPSQASGEELFVIDDSAADSTAPTVSTFSPADDDTGVSASVTPTITFSEAIRSADVDATHFMLVQTSDGAVESSTIAVTDAANKVVTITPDSSLSASTEYRVWVVKGVRDTAGNELAATTSADWTTSA